MLSLFEETSIKSMILKNRFVRSATWEGLANDCGVATPRLVRLMTDLARGGVGLIITSHAFVRSDGRAGPWQLGVCDKKHKIGLKNMTDVVHRENGRIVLQLAHAGCKAATNLSGELAVGPSASRPNETPCSQLTAEDIQQLVSEFARAAVLARDVGFDGVQLHAAHGYLLSQFLSPHYNRRTDHYGGCQANRAKALLETMEAVRREVGQDFPVFAKINTDDTISDGVRPPDMVETAIQLEEAGVDAIELSGGCKDGRHLPARKGFFDTMDEEVYYRGAARLFKKKIKVPLILVGGIRSFETAENLVHDESVDYISMSRPFIREPDIVNRWREGDRRPSACRSDNLCYGPIRSGEGIRCALLEPDV